MKKESEGMSMINQVLELPTGVGVRGQAWKERGNSYLVKCKGMGEERLPKLPKMVSTGEIVGTKEEIRKERERSVQMMVREKLLETQFKANKLKLEYRWCDDIREELNSLEKREEEGNQIWKDKQRETEISEQTNISPSHSPSKQRTVSKSLAPTTNSSFYNYSPISKITQPTKHLSPSKRQPLSISPSLPKSILAPHPRYKKGYFVYSPACLSCFRNRNQIPQRPTLLPTTPPSISAKSYCIIDSHTLKPLYFHKHTNQPLQIASLTKIVTCLLTILACSKYDINISEYKCRVSEEASGMIGTSAELASGDLLTIEQLLYGLMLPSGNDAAVALAENIGRIIQRKKKIREPGNPVTTFVRQMNVLYREIIEQQQHQKHVFRNPSGLIFNPNLTTLQQITIFATLACKNITFYQIINARTYEVNIMNQKVGIARKVVWKNTNKLLWKGWEGVKTGTTENAGHCFIGKYESNIFGLLECGSLERRFGDAEELKRWICREGKEEKEKKRSDY